MDGGDTGNEEDDVDEGICNERRLLIAFVLDILFKFLFVIACTNNEEVSIDKEGFSCSHQRNEVCC